LGASQLRDRTAGVARVSLLPLGMTIFSVSGTWTSLSASPHLPGAAVAWAAAAVTAVTAVALVAPDRTAAQFDPASRTFRLPGSVVPLLLIVGIFLVKYGVGIELALAPQRVRDAQFALGIAAVYGAFTGVFVGRAARLWRMAWRPAAAYLPA
jgi:hypothetical protein